MIFPSKKVIFGSIILVLLLGLSIFLIQLKSRKQRQFDGFILEAATKYRIDPALVKAVIWQESKFDPLARGKAGEIGLMQIREDAAWEWAEAEKIRSFNHEQITDPRKNIHCGTYYLSKLYKRYLKTDNPIPYALADYNAGRTHVLRWNKGAASTNSALFLQQMDYPGTRQYALNVMRKKLEYEKQFSRVRR